MRTVKSKKLKQRDDIDTLYAAITDYVRNRGGKVLVIGGILVEEWPQEPAMCFRIAVKCTGRKPSYATSP